MQVGLLVLEGFITDSMPEGAAWADGSPSEGDSITSQARTVAVRGSASSSTFTADPGFVRS